MSRVNELVQAMSKAHAYLVCYLVLPSDLVSGCWALDFKVGFPPLVFLCMLIPGHFPSKKVLKPKMICMPQAPKEPSKLRSHYL